MRLRFWRLCAVALLVVTFSNYTFGDYTSIVRIILAVTALGLLALNGYTPIPDRMLIGI